MAAPLTTGRATGRVVHFVTPDGDQGFARQFGCDYWGGDRWCGWRLLGAQNKRAGA